MKLFRRLIYIAILASSSGYVASESLETGDIENFNNVWAKSFDEGNTKGLMGLYTENAVVFPPSSEILKGRGEIQDYLDSLKKVGVEKYSISNIDTDIKENTIYETALWEATRMDAAGNVIKMEGNISNVFEKQEDGSWKIKFQSWN
ncbi:MAG: SnoaL-like domain-containing protein [Proteobacteria bacterium]|nr:DUF4440 domain-containing protein [Pseudomonadota bacterium]NOG59660.1 SnoaL-like domain-containing protein [Pseudomonadota bacterium]